MSIPCPTTNSLPPRLAEPVERLLALVDDGDLPARLVERPRASAEPTRPQPTMSAFTRPL